MQINKLYKTKQNVCTSIKKGNFLFPLNFYKKDEVVFLLKRESINTFKFLTKNEIQIVRSQQNVFLWLKEYEQT